MTIPTGLRRVAVFPIYPILGAAYPVVFLYAQNVQEAIAPSEVLIPLAVSAAATLAVVILLRGLIGQWAPAALMSSLLLALFFTYGMAWDGLGPYLLGEWELLVGWAVVAILGLVLIWLFRGYARHVTLPLNIFMAIALLVNLIVIAGFVLNIRPIAASTGSGVTAIGEADPSAPTPDIYWIVVEEYGSQRVLSEDFHFDNSPFLNALRDRGFYIADESTANYLKTAPSIQSARNLEYLDAPTLRSQAKSPSDWGPIYNGLQSPFEVQQFLGALDYRFVYAGTFWAPMATHPSAEINYVYEGLTSEFLETLQQATILRALRDLGPQAPYDWRRNRWNQTLYELRSLEHASDLGGPKFVHAQLALDHEPYVFHPDGSFVTEDEEREMSHEQQYVGQLQYTNTQMVAWVDQLLDVPEDQRPIIMLLADEGPWPNGYRYNERTYDWTSATPTELAQKFGILNAVYLPGKSAEEAGFYPSITPVNEFRVLFNAYFGLDLPLLPDRNYIWPNQSDIYNLIDVTDRLER